MSEKTLAEPVTVSREKCADALEAVLELETPSPTRDAWDHGYQAAMDEVRQVIYDAMGASDD